MIDIKLYVYVHVYFCSCDSEKYQANLVGCELMCSGPHVVTALPQSTTQSS